jgi:inner membrane protein
MDPLTHSLVGAALARTRLARGLPLAGAALVAGANLPDVDVASQFGGADVALAFRRGWTHGPLALVVLPALLTGLLLGLDALLRRRDPGRAPMPARRLAGLAYLGCLTHPALDWLNTYGIRLLMPFDRRWFYGDAVFIVDPWLWLLLGGAVFLGSRGRAARVGWSLAALGATAVVLAAGAFVPGAARWVWFGGLLLIAAARWVPALVAHPGRVATAALALAALYVGAMLVATSATERRVLAALPGEGVGEVRELMIAPAPADPFHWEVVLATERVYRLGSFRWWPAPRLELDPGAIARPEPLPLFDAVLRAEQVRGAVGWMRFPFLEVERTPAGFRVWLLDARYARPGDRGFGTVSLELDRGLEVIDE